MADVSALLAQYLSVKSQISYNQLQQTKWADLHESMSAKLSTQTKAEEQWQEAYDTAEEKALNGEEVKKPGGGILLAKSEKGVSGSKAQKIAYEYAELKVPNYDPEKLDEYAELDMQYDLMQSTYDTLLDELNAQAESLKTTLGNATKDTGMLDQ